MFASFIAYQVEVASHLQLDQLELQENIAYVQMTHVEPYREGFDASSYEAHTNIKVFTYEVAITDDKVSEDAPQVARQALKKIFVTGTI